MWEKNGPFSTMKPQHIYTVENGGVKVQTLYVIRKTYAQTNNQWDKGEPTPPHRIMDPFNFPLREEWTANDGESG